MFIVSIISVNLVRRLQQALSDLARLDGDSDQAFQAGVLECRWLFYCHLSLQKHLCCTCMTLKSQTPGQ